MVWTKIKNTGQGLFLRISDYLLKSPFNRTFVRGLMRWLPYIIGSFLTAVFAVFYSRAFDWIDILSSVIKLRSPWLFFVITPVCFLAGWWIIRKISPAATGSGIPQVMAALNPKRDGKKVTRGYLLGGRVIIAKLLSSLTVLIGGAVIGKEGPIIQIGTSVFYVVHKFLPSNWPRMNRERMIIAGGAAGLAAAFNTPLGGIVFAIEELTKTSLNAFKSTLLFAIIFTGMTVQWILGPYLYLGYPKVQDGFDLLVWVVLFSAIAGLVGALNGRLIYLLVRFVHHLRSNALRILYVLAAGLAVALIIFVNKGPAYGPGKEVINSLLFQDGKQDASLFLMISRFFSTIISYSTGVAGGIFAPSLSTGSILGHLLMTLFALDEENKLLILVCMIGVLTGITRAPFTSSILVLEMTDRHSAIFFFILAGLIASYVAKLVDKKPVYYRLEENFLTMHNGSR